jgi:hypothetical protein
MKTKHLTLGLVLLIILNLLSCQKDKNLTHIPADAKVKRILLYFSIDSDSPTSIVKEFLYDEIGRISKTTSPMYQNGTIIGTISYDLYYYNTSGQLLKKENFNANLNSPTGFINLINHSYSYSADGKMTKETIEYPQIGTGESILYEYMDNQQSTIKFYNNKNQLETYIINSYDNSGRLIKETKYASDDKLISITTHIYNGQLLIKSDVFQSDTHIREINRTYDNNNNLLILQSKELVGYSSALSFFHKYEYFD